MLSAPERRDQPGVNPAVRGHDPAMIEPEFALPEDIELLHDAEMAVLTTVERPEDAPRLLSWGLDALESGDPAMVAAAIRAAGVGLPTRRPENNRSA